MTQAKGWKRGEGNGVLSGHNDKSPIKRMVSHNGRTQGDWVTGLEA